MHLFVVGGRVPKLRVLSREPEFVSHRFKLVWSDTPGLAATVVDKNVPSNCGISQVAVIIKPAVPPANPEV